MTKEPAWVTDAKKLIGTKEIKGGVHNQKIVDLWKAAKMSGIKDDDTPWCACFVNAMMEKCGIKGTRSAAAKSFLNWGVVLKKPIFGCVVVFVRSGGGHVGFALGTDADGHILVLGGNQGDEVNIRAFVPDRIVGYRWPENVPVPAYQKLAVSTAVQLSTRES